MEQRSYKDTIMVYLWLDDTTSAMMSSLQTMCVRLGSWISADVGCKEGTWSSHAQLKPPPPPAPLFLAHTLTCPCSQHQPRTAVLGEVLLWRTRICAVPTATTASPSRAEEPLRAKLTARCRCCTRRCCNTQTSTLHSLPLQRHLRVLHTSPNILAHIISHALSKLRKAQLHAPPRPLPRQCAREPIDAPLCATRTGRG